MSRLISGGKSGLFAGMLYGAIAGFANYLIFIFQKALMMGLLSNVFPTNSPFTIDQLYTITMYALVVVFVLLGLILGAILGLIFGSLYDSIPGKRAISKGLTFSIIVWALLELILNIRNLINGVTYIVETVLIGLVASMAYGYLLGALFDRYLRSEEVAEDPFAGITE